MRSAAMATNDGRTRQRARERPGDETEALLASATVSASPRRRAIRPSFNRLRSGGARWLLKARILLKADKSDAGAGWNDCQIAAALDTSVDTVGRTRKTLEEECLDAALARRHSPHSARKRIFDGAAEAKLMPSPVRRHPKGAAGGPSSF
jgi:hypothetical protein